MAERQNDLIKLWENATLANNFLFCKIMSSDKELCRELLEILLEIEIDHLEEPSPEKTMMESIVSKSVRFDVYAKNSTQVFDIEMQTNTSWKADLAKRTRYYQSVMDMDALQAGQRYSRLKDSYVIFICLNDPFGKNQPVYRFENMCLTYSDNEAEEKAVITKLEDKAYKIFFNASACDKMKTNEKARNFLKILRGEKARDEFSKKLEEKVNFAKTNIKYRGQFMTFQELLEDEKDYARAEGLKEGIEKGARANAIENSRKLLEMKLLTVEQIAEATGLTEEEVRKLN